MSDFPIDLPAQYPQPGFYYHYKHFTENPEDHIESYAYEVLGLGFHTEENYFLVEYRPLYDAVVYRASSALGVPVTDNRPVSMFMETVEKEGISRPRFTPITDEKTIELLTAVRNRMYS